MLVEEIIVFFSPIAYAFFLYAPFILLFPSDFFSQQNHKITLAPTSTIEFEKSIEEKKRKRKKEKRIKSRRKKEKQKKSLGMVQRKRKMVGMRKRKKNMGGAMWGFVCWI